MRDMTVELQVGVKVLLKNPEGKYLFLHRSAEKYPETQKWDIPGGILSRSMRRIGQGSSEKKFGTRVSWKERARTGRSRNLSISIGRSG